MTEQGEEIGGGGGERVIIVLLFLGARYLCDKLICSSA